MAETENLSNFNGLIIEIRGKALIHNLYLEHINQHQIEIGLPHLDNVDKQIILSQNGNANNPIDLSKYSLIEIVEISQQPTAARQREDINLEPALARNQVRLSDFYQSYKNEDSSIDWSKVATKITLSNTSGTFYDHEDKYTTGLKIEFSTQGVESIEFRDGTTSETITTLSASELPITMVISNLCKIDPQEGVKSSSPPPLLDISQGVFCSPQAGQTQYNPTITAWSLCANCGVIYNNQHTPTMCFGNLSGNPSGHSAVTGYSFGLPYNTPSTGNDTQGSGYRCFQCQAIYCPYAANTHCPASPQAYHTIPNSYGVTHYWAMVDFQLTHKLTFNMCKECGSLYYPKNDSLGVKNACYNNSETHTPVKNTTYDLTGEIRVTGGEIGASY